MRIVLLILFLLLGNVASAQPLLTGAGSTHSVAAPSCSQASAFLARAGTLDGTHTAAYTGFICGGVSDGWWAGLDAFYMLATQTSAAALLNLISNTCNLTATAAPTFTANSGFTGNGTTQYLDNGCAMNAASHFTQNSATFGGKVTSATNYNSEAYGNYVVTHSNNLFFPPSSTTIQTDLNSTITSASVTVSSIADVIVATRASSSAITLYANGSSVGTPTLVSLAVASEHLFILGASATDLVANVTPEFVFFGGLLSPTDISNLQARWATYKAAVGAP